MAVSSFVWVFENVVKSIFQESPLEYVPPSSDDELSLSEFESAFDASEPAIAEASSAVVAFAFDPLDIVIFESESGC